MNPARKRPRSNPGGPTILGSDGRFQLVQNAMDVPGFHVAVNVFSPALHRRLFDCPTFETNPVPFVTEQQVPIQQAMVHPLDGGLNGPWPEDFHRVINSVRDSGLFPSATIPDLAYALTYRPGSKFPAHWDGRGKWGEYVISATLGAPCTITFQHAAPKGKPVDPSRPWNWIPDDPKDLRSKGEDVYWTRSQTTEEVSLNSYGSSKRRLWQVTMTLPPNAIYVMSGPSRYDWRHGVNCDPNHPVPPSSRSLVAASGAVERVPTAYAEWLYPKWNPSNLRRAIIYRSTKTFSDYCLELEFQRALDEEDSHLITKVNERKDAAYLYPPEDQKTRKYTEEEIAEKHEEAKKVVDRLQASGAHRLRFPDSMVQYEVDGRTRAAGDIYDDDDDDDDGGDEDATTAAAAAGGSNNNHLASKEPEPFTGEGRRLGESWQNEIEQRKPQQQQQKKRADVIELLDSSEDEDEVEQQGAMSAKSLQAIKAEGSGVGKGMSRAGRAALQRLAALESNESGAVAAAASVPLSNMKKEGAWQCSHCTLFNDATEPQCKVCGVLRDPSATSAATSDFFAVSSGDSRLGLGHASSLRNKHDYLNDSGLGRPVSNTSTTDTQCYTRGTMLADNHPRTYKSGGWLWVNSPEFKSSRPDKVRVDKESDIVAFQQEYQRRVGLKEERTTQRMILELAQKHNVKHGKWLLRVLMESVEDVWSKLRDAVLANKLGPTAKISDAIIDGGVFQVCVYTTDFTDKEEILRVRRAIHELGIFTKTTLFYKPDAFTLLDLYAGDVKGLRTTIYSCGGKATKTRREDLDCTTLISAEMKCTNAPGCPRCYPKCIGL